MSTKKYKYSVKKFARLLTVHPDKRVTFQDTIDLRVFIGPQDGIDGLEFKTMTDMIVSIAADDARIWTAERNDYWPELVEHGHLLTITNHDFEPPPVRIVATGPQRFNVTVEFELNAEKVAAWLAATGFPQLSRAKEAPDANSAVTG